MHRSSESVAAIATALAKAQTELSNPEKAMVGTVYNNRSESPQSFRYASLSSGLDIVRKALGSQQIAIAQTTPNAYLGRMDRVGLASLRPLGAVATPPHGGSSHVRTTLRLVHLGGDSWRGGPGSTRSVEPICLG